MDTDDVVLNPSERVLWAGGPRRSGLFSLAAGVVVSGVLTWVAFAYVGAGWRWFLLVCAVSGLSGAIGDWRRRRSTRYVVTTERVMVSIQVPGRGRTEQVAQLAGVTPRLGPADRQGNRTVHLDGAVIPPLHRVAGAEQLRDLIVSTVGRPAGPRVEQSLWTGRPTVTRVWNPGDVGLFVFGCFFILFSLVGVVVVPFVASNRDSVVPAVIFGSVGVLIGIGMSFGRTFLRGWRLKRTEYIITSDRLIIRDGREFAARLSALPFPVPQINLDGVGTIRFGKEAWEVPNGRIRRDGDRTRKFVLHAIPDAQHIHDLIVAARTPHD